MSGATEGTISKFDAENATSMTVDFLRRLGYRQSWIPNKVSLDGDLYVVEMMHQMLTAKVQINSKTKEIKEYEFTGNEIVNKSAVNSKLLLLLVGGIPTVILVLNILGVFGV